MPGYIFIAKFRIVWFELVPMYRFGNLTEDDCSTKITIYYLIWSFQWSPDSNFPHLQVWQLDEGCLLKDPNVIYTFDFFHPWSYISNETGAVRNVKYHRENTTLLNSVAIYTRWAMEQSTLVNTRAMMSSKDGWYPLWCFNRTTFRIIITMIRARDIL